MSIEPVAAHLVDPAHPLVACADAVEAALKDVAGVDPAFLRARDKAEVLVRLHTLEGRLTGLRLRVMAAAEELADTTADQCGDLAGGPDPYRPAGPSR
jgi:hypothetical protein